MKTITPKEFIQQVLINEVGEIHEKFPYISFATMAIGIEFLGKCLNSEEDWNKPNQSKIDFEYAINNLTPFEKYRDFLSEFELWTSLRNGFLHSFVPKNKLTLSSKDEMEHLRKHNGKLNLKCEDLYSDFKSACEDVLNMTTFLSNKMILPLLYVPDNSIDNNISFSGSTYQQI
jgi:hypothetical protein